MLEEGKKGSIPNPKIPKTFTPRQQIGNFEKIMQLRLPLLEKWITIINAIYCMSPQKRKLFTDYIADSHQLEEYLGAEWRQRLGIEEHKITNETIAIAEVQIGIKCGEE